MEEHGNSTSRALLLACVLIGAAAGSSGGYFWVNEFNFGGVNEGSYRNALKWAHEKALVDALVGGAIVGCAVGCTAALLRPKREEWSGAFAATVLVAVSAIASAAVTGIGFYLACRFIQGYA